MILSIGRKPLFTALFSLVMLWPRWAVGQGAPLFVLDIAGTPVGEFPTGVKQLQGIMEVVIKDGQPMLKASARSEFLITLPRVLPQAFTLEFDLVPKAGGGNPQDLSFEGSSTINQGGSSAHVLWDSDGSLQIIGGGQTYDAPMPEEFRTTLPGVLTNVVVTVDGPTIKLYTNGRRLYTLDRQFARGRVLRVFLGGQDDGAYAVHLAGLRISAGAGVPGVIAAQPGIPTQTQPGQPAPPAVPPAAPPTLPPAPSTAAPTTGQSQRGSGGTNLVVPNVAVSQGTGGPVVTWGLLNGVSSYTVKRWKIDDFICCNRTSPTLSGPPWQDGSLPMAGTYVYEVTASTPVWVATGQAQFVQLKSPGQIATVAPPGPIAPSSPAVTAGVTGVTSSTAAPPNPALAKLLPPPSRVLVLNGFTGAGAAGLVPSRALVLPAWTVSGAFQHVASRTLTLASITGTGPVIVLNRTRAPTGAAAVPASRTMTLPAISAAGVAAAPLSRIVSLTGFTGAGSYGVVAARVLNLAGWTAVGLYP